jgi:hypothetical protein
MGKDGHWRLGLGNHHQAHQKAKEYCFFHNDMVLIIIDYQYE